MRILAKFQGKSGLQNEKRPRTCFRVSLIRFRNTAAKTSTRQTENVWLAWVSALSHVNVQARGLPPAVRPLIEWTEPKPRKRQDFPSQESPVPGLTILPVVVSSLLATGQVRNQVGATRLYLQLYSLERHSGMHIRPRPCSQ